MIALPTFRGALAGFNPLSLAPALWLNDTGSDPSVWTDISGNGRNAVQATGANQPSIVTGAVNGKQVRRFDGVNDFLALTTGLGMLRNVPGATIIVAYKWTTNPTVNSAIFIASSGATLGFARAIVSGGSSSRKLMTGGRRLDGDGFASINSINDNPTTYFIHSGVLDYANSNAFQYVNGTLDGENTSFQTDGNTSNTDSLGIAIGSSGAGTAFANVDIAEILVFPTALSATNRQRVERYLAGKYAITI